MASVSRSAGVVTRYAYGPGGQVTHQWGSGTYPLRMEYDAFGRMTKLHTYQGGGAAWDAASLPSAFQSQVPATTTWKKDARHPNS